jgi:DNA modification methylase
MTYDPRDDAFKSYEAAIDALRAKHINARKVVRIGDCELILGDCLDVLPNLPSVPHVLTDPPYDKEAHTQQRRVRRGNEALEFEALEFEALEFEALDKYSRQLVRVSEGWLLTFCQAENVTHWRDSVERVGGKYRRAMVWIKPDGMPQYSGDRPGMGYESIAASWCGKGRSVWNGGGKHGVFTHCKNDFKNGAPHPTTKPKALMRELVDLFTEPAQTILDPFMGSGTTGVACVQLQRKFIGIELDETYFDIACKRIEEAYKQPSLFPAEKPKPKKTGDLFAEDAA